MKFNCCEGAMSYFMIYKDLLSFCYCLVDGKYCFDKISNNNEDFIEKYINERKQFIENCKNGRNIPQKCLKCSFFKEADWDETLGIDLIGLANHTKCSCNCIYCIVTKGDSLKRKELNKQDLNINIIPILDKLSEEKLLKKNCRLYLVGGDCSEYPKSEMLYLIDYAAKNNLCIEFPTSGLFFSKEIETALKTIKSKVIISIDAGTKETFEKIKRTKYWDSVWENIKQYQLAAQDNLQAQVFAKYIILNGVNDNIEEFSEFMNKCDENGIKHMEISLDHNIINDDDKNKMPDKMVELLNYINRLNDKRITTSAYTPILEYKTSAKTYSQSIENDLVNGNTILDVVIFSAKKESYERITKNNLYDNIWENIKKYSEKLGCNSKIKLVYKLIFKENTSDEELSSLILKCRELNILEIKIDIYKDIVTDTDELDKVLNFFKKQRDIKILYCDNIHNYIDGNYYLLGAKKE